MASEIRNADLWQDGQLKIEWVKRHAPLLNSLEREFSATRPFDGLKIALSVHLEAKTAYLCEVLAAGGAQMYVTGSNPLSTQDDVAAALVHEGLNVFAWYGATAQEYEAHIRRVLEVGPNIIIDDGGDLVNLMRTEFRIGFESDVDIALSVVEFAHDLVALGIREVPTAVFRDFRKGLLVQFN